MEIKTIIVHPDSIELLTEKVNVFTILKRVEGAPCDLDINIWFDEEGLLKGLRQNELIAPLLDAYYYYYMRVHGGPVGTAVIQMEKNEILPFEKIKKEYEDYGGRAWEEFQKAMDQFI